MLKSINDSQPVRSAGHACAPIEICWYHMLDVIEIQECLLW